MDRSNSPRFAARPRRVRLLATVPLLAVVALAGSATAPAARAEIPAALERHLGQLLQQNPGFPGIAIAVRAPGVAWTGASGRADRAGTDPLRADATFRIASVTKTFTAAAVLRLVEQRRVRLDEPVSAYLAPASLALLRADGYDVDAIHVRHLLQHTSGIYDYAGDPAFVTYVVTHPTHRWTRLEQLSFAMTHGDPLAAPGAAFSYSDTGYILLGEIIERVTGRSLAASYRSLLHERRLGLDETYLESLEPPPPNARARAHQYLGSYDLTTADPSFDLYGGGGLVSTVDDLARFFRALFAGQVFDRPGTLRTMLGRPGSPRPQDIGMGIFAESIGRATCWHHDGFWGVSVVHCPGSGTTISTTVNQFEGFDAPTHELQAFVLGLLR